MHCSSGMVRWAVLLAAFVGTGSVFALPPPPSVRIVLAGQAEGDGASDPSSLRLLEALQYQGPVPGGSLTLHRLEARTEIDACPPAADPAGRACLADLSGRLRAGGGAGPVVIIAPAHESPGELSWLCIASAPPSAGSPGPEPVRFSPGRWEDDRSGAFLADRLLAQGCILKAASASGW